MKSQQAAEREEQQRIKNLVLNYDLNTDDQHDGTFPCSLAPIAQPIIVSRRYAKRSQATRRTMATSPEVNGVDVRPEHGGWISKT